MRTGTVQIDVDDQQAGNHPHKGADGSPMTTTSKQNCNKVTTKYSGANWKAD
jgi:hypothetical protein